MRKVTLICYGKLKFPGMLDSVAEFTKRLSRYTEFEVIELKPLKVADKSESLRDTIREKEAAQILEIIEARRTTPVWCLTETGKAMKTSEWAKAFADITLGGPAEIILIIGGSLGLSESLIKKANRSISLGPQTLSHELARLVLVEQVYRTLSLLAGHPYHNEG